MTSIAKTFRDVVAVAVLAVVVFSPGVAALMAQAPPVGIDMVAALRSTPGCLGVESARTASGKQVIFAWFEDKKALLAWVQSDAHQGLIRTLTPGASSGRTPLSGIADESGPILAIASLTSAEKAQIDGVKIPVSQISIELYAPLPGGLAIGGRFAPNTVAVPGLLDVTRP